MSWQYRTDRTPQWNGRYAGQEIGCVAYFNKGGPYRVANIEGTTYLVHRLIWLYVKGYMPDYIDHRNGVGLNNIWDNLREATQSQNNANTNITARGVTIHGNGFKARIKVNGVQIHLGTHRTRELAQAAYNTAADKYFGEFARINR